MQSHRRPAKGPPALGDDYLIMLIALGPGTIACSVFLAIFEPESPLRPDSNFLLTAACLILFFLPAFPVLGLCLARACPGDGSAGRRLGWGVASLFAPLLPVALLEASSRFAAGGWLLGPAAWPPLIRVSLGLWAATFLVWKCRLALSRPRGTDDLTGFTEP